MQFVEQFINRQDQVGVTDGDAVEDAIIDPKASGTILLMEKQHR